MSRSADFDIAYRRAALLRSFSEPRWLPCLRKLGKAQIGSSNQITVTLPK
jgi:hypothetical protein